MSSKSIDKKVVHLDIEITESFQVKDIIIPYSLFFRRQEPFIYSGQEKMPFEKRHPLYKSIMLNEFRG
jgi:hypothetical protein